jgi:hypothetical protein
MVVLVALTLLSVLGVIGFKYPVMVEGDKLRNPVHVQAVENGIIRLDDRRVIQVDRSTTEILKLRLAESNGMLELKQLDKSEVEVYTGRTMNGYCGTPFSQPLCIPLIKVKIPKHLKFFVCQGTIVQAENKQ